MHLRPGRWISCARARVFERKKKLKVNGKPINKVDKVKFLGVIIDENLSWEPQIGYLKVQLISSINIIKRIKKFI